MVARSIATTLHINASEANFQEMLTSGLSFDATVAVPDAGNPFPGNSYFLRAGVDEIPTGHIGTLEISTESIKLPPPPTIAAASKQGQ